MNLPFASLFMAAVEAGPNPGLGHRGLAIVLGFATIIVFIGAYFRSKRLQMWHETTRLAIEKGQPLPEGIRAGMGRRFGHMAAWRDLRRGLILLAIGAGLYLGDTGRPAVAILGCVGGVYLLLGVIGLMRPEKPANIREEPTKL